MAPRTPNHRPFTPRQQRQNARFLAALRRTGNVRLACRQLGVNRSTYTRRRARCAAFAADWDWVLAAAHAAFHRAGGERMPEARRKGRAVIASRGAARQTSLDRHDAGDDELRTKGGEPTIIRQANGRLQLRLAPPGRMTGAACRLLLATVAETNNLRLSAAAAGGVAHTTILARLRRDPALAVSLATARRIGADRVLWEIMHPPGRPDPAEADFAYLPMPETTVEQCLLQLGYHRPGGRFQRYRWRARPLPRPWEEYRPRVIARLNAWRRAEWFEVTGSWWYPSEDPTE